MLQVDQMTVNNTTALYDSEAGSMQFCAQTVGTLISVHSSEALAQSLTQALSSSHIVCVVALVIV